MAWRPHPWHGLAVGPDPPRVITAYVEITPFDVVKYEVDKQTGYLAVDRPHRGAATPPTLYGLIPRTYCGPRVAALSPGVEVADGDPLDVCVISERTIDRSDITLTARVVGGLRMLDGGEADDKIIAVLENDDVWQDAEDIADIPIAYVERLRHYFSTYKLIRGKENTTKITGVYDREHASKVVQAAMADYDERYEY